MDNLQTQASNQTTGNPQSIGQSSLAAPNNNLQGSVGNQEQLLKLPASGLQVTSCNTDCSLAGLQPAPVKSSNATAVGVTILVVVLLVLVWRFMAVIQKASSKHSIDEIAELDDEVSIEPESISKKASKKHKK